jgi:hypothetical protein
MATHCLWMRPKAALYSAGIRRRSAVKSLLSVARQIARFV